MTMKQRITIDDMNELTNAQKDRLREIWKPEPCDVYASGLSRNVVMTTYESDHGTVIMHMVPAGDSLFNEPYRNIHYKVRCLPLLSIGQMIELLNDKTLQTYIFTQTNRERKSIVYHDIIGYEKFDTFAGHSAELCDALWQAVKQIL